MTTVSLLVDPAFSAPRLSTSSLRRTIVIGTDEYRVNTESIAALAALGGVYRRHRRLVEVNGLGWARSVRVIPADRLRELLSQAADYIQHFASPRTGAETFQRVRVPGWCVRAVRVRGEWPGILPLPVNLEGTRR